MATPLEQDAWRFKPFVARALCCIALAGLTACEGAPARSKPWRHADRRSIAATATTATTETEPATNVAEPLRPTIAARQLAPARPLDNSTLRVHMDARPRHLNPIANPSSWTSRITADTVFETLIEYRPPEGGSAAGAGSYAPGLASEWSVAPGGKEIRIQLQEQVVFHDGERMTSVDVQFSLDMARSRRVAADRLRRLLADVSAVELINSRSLRIRLSRPNGYALRALAMVPIVPEHVYRGAMTPTRGPVIGTGPYRLQTWDENRIRLERFESYWGRQAHVPAIEFIYEQDAAKAVTAAKHGQLDLLPALIRQHYPEQAEAPAVKARFTPVRLHPASLTYIALGQQPPLDDVRVRKAISLLVDRDTIIAEERGGLARAASGLVWPGGPGDGPGRSRLAYQPKQALALLDQAGWINREGSRQRNGERLHVSLLALPGSSRAERDRIVRGLRTAGFFVEVRRGSSAVLMGRLRAGDFDLALLRWRSDVDTDLAPLLETGGSDNFGRFSDPSVDQVFARLRGARTPADRRPLIAELDMAIADRWPIVPIARADPYGLVHRRVHGISPWNGWFSLRDVWLGEP